MFAESEIGFSSFGTEFGDGPGKRARRGKYNAKVRIFIYYVKFDISVFEGVIFQMMATFIKNHYLRFL